MTANDSFGSLIVQDKILDGMLQLRGGSKLGTISAAVQHEGGALTV